MADVAPIGRALIDGLSYMMLGSTGQGVYMSAVAEQLTGAERERGIEVFSRRTVAQGAEEWTLADVSPPARLRLYRATASEHFVLTPRDRRVPVSVEQLARATV